ncbi:MAG: hypothetical protein JJ902_17860 [Roseibium sp.]|nr:hypothetical protein [Roseibium sp.]
MTSVSGGGSAEVNAANIRNQLAANAIKDQNAQERQVAERLEDAQATSEEDRRESRKIPGLGEAVDISV